MKKVINIIVILISLLFIGNTTLAASAEVNVVAPTAIEEGTKIVELTVSLGMFQQMEEGQTLGFQATLQYGKDIFESVTVEGLNGWDVSYEEESKIVIGLTKESKADVDIARFKFIIKDDVIAGTIDNIVLNNFLLTNDDTLNQEENYAVQFSVVANSITESPEVGETENQAENNIYSETQNIVAKDNTIKNINRLPAAGISNVIIISVVIILILGVGFLIYSRSIKLK